MKIKLQKRIKQMVIPTYFLEDIRLSLGAKGLYAWLFSKEFDGEILSVIKTLNVSEDEFIKYFNELESCGYTKYKTNKTDGDFFQLLDTPINATEVRLSKERFRQSKNTVSFTTSCKNAILDITIDPSLIYALENYLKLRLNPPKESRLSEIPLKSLLDWKTLLQSLIKLSGNKVDIVNRSIDNHWAKFVSLDKVESEELDRGNIINEYF